LLPTRNTQYCQDMSSRTGESLMKAVWNSPLITLFEAWADDSQKPPAPEALLTDFRAPGPDVIAWPTMPGPGFIFGCSSDTMDECLGRGLFGLPAHMKTAASSIVVGSTIFLFNVTDRLLFGIFEALTPAVMNIIPTAFSKHPNAKTSPFPVQIHVRVSLECPPLEDSDELLNDILRSRGSGRIGALTHAQAEAIASLLAAQCGALQYMLEYQKGIEEGARVRPPPIALPPRKIVPKDSNQQQQQEQSKTQEL
jgi:cleavage and polyadenylation specificity factor subunit 4